MSVDLVCIGGGLGGLAAAVRARSLGLSALVVERSSLLGGVAAFSGGRLWAPCSHLAEQAGHHDSVDEAIRYLEFTLGPDARVDLGLRSAFLDAVPAALRFYSHQAEVPFSLVPDYPDQYHPAPGSTASGRFVEVAVEQVTAEMGPDDAEWLSLCRRGHHYHPQSTWNAALELGRCEYPLDPPLTRGEALAVAFVRAAVRHHVPIIRDADVSRLLVDDGRVVGIEIEHGGALQSLHATRGVVIASGSYGSRSDAAATENLPELGDAGPPVSYGDALRLCSEVGASVVRAGSVFTVLGADLGDGYDQSGRRRLRQVFDRTGLPHGMIVNTAGHRFGDESCYNDLVNATAEFDVRTRRFPNSPCFFVCDEQYRSRYATGPEVPWEMSSSFTSADTLSGLAGQLGIDPVGLGRTVERLNEAARTGVDADFGRGELLRYRTEFGDASDAGPNPNLGTVECAPFWGIRLVPMSVGVHSLGLQIDPSARVRRRDGSTIAGLWATGNAVAHTEQPRYTGGFANARNIVYAYLAASDAAGPTAVGDDEVAR